MMDQPEDWKSKLKRFIKETLRVIRITRKPDSAEFKGIIKVTSLGIAVIGVLGFVIFIVKQLLF